MLSFCFLCAAGEANTKQSCMLQDMHCRHACLPAVLVTALGTPAANSQTRAAPACAGCCGGWRWT